MDILPSFYRRASVKASIRSRSWTPVWSGQNTSRQAMIKSWPCLFGRWSRKSTWSKRRIKWTKLVGRVIRIAINRFISQLTEPNLSGDRHQMAYLDKLIMLVGKSLNTFVDARPAKIVAGLEAENTNRLLQLLALAAVERPDSFRCVARSRLSSYMFYRC